MSVRPFVGLFVEMCGTNGVHTFAVEQPSNQQWPMLVLRTWIQTEKRAGFGVTSSMHKRLAVCRSGVKFVIASWAPVTALPADPCAHRISASPHASAGRGGS